MPRRPKKPKNPVREWCSALIWAAVLSLVLRSTVAAAYYVPSGSMLPTLHIGDQMLVNELAYDLRLPFSDKVLWATGTPGRGDVVVFANPDGQGPDYVKRVIGLPGETVLVREQVVYIDGHRLDDRWGHLDTGAKSSPDFGPAVVPPDHYFVMGDNRLHSYDSRYWNDGRGGFVPRADIRGRASVILWTWMGLPQVLSLERSGTMLD